MGVGPPAVTVGARVTRFSGQGEVLVRHSMKDWLVVADDHGGSRYGVSSKDEPNPIRAREECEFYLKPGYHLEVREQVWWSTEPSWATIECDMEAAATTSKGSA